MIDASAQAAVESQLQAYTQHNLDRLIELHDAIEALDPELFNVQVKLGGDPEDGPSMELALYDADGSLGWLAYVSHSPQFEEPTKDEYGRVVPGARIPDKYRWGFWCPYDGDEHCRTITDRGQSGRDAITGLLRWLRPEHFAHCRKTIPLYPLFVGA